jgi:hypothetical protein
MGWVLDWCEDPTAQAESANGTVIAINFFIVDP